MGREPLPQCAQSHLLPHDIFSTDDPQNQWYHAGDQSFSTRTWSSGSHVPVSCCLLISANCICQFPQRVWNILLRNEVSCKACQPSLISLYRIHILIMPLLVLYENIAVDIFELLDYTKCMMAECGRKVHSKHTTVGGFLKSRIFPWASPRLQDWTPGHIALLDVSAYTCSRKPQSAVSA